MTLLYSNRKSTFWKMFPIPKLHITSLVYWFYIIRGCYCYWNARVRLCWWDPSSPRDQSWGRIKMKTKSTGKTGDHHHQHRPVHSPPWATLIRMLLMTIPVFLIIYKYTANQMIRKPSDPEKQGLGSDKCWDVRDWESLIMHWGLNR